MVRSYAYRPKYLTCLGNWLGWERNSNSRVIR